MKPKKYTGPIRRSHDWAKEDGSTVLVCRACKARKGFAAGPNGLTPSAFVSSVCPARSKP